MDTRYGIDEKNIVFEIFEKEVVLVSLDSGHYFVLEQTAGDIWCCLANGLSLAETRSLLLKRYSVEEARIAADLATFIVQLTDESLLLEVTGDTTVVEGLTLPQAASPTLPYVSPFLFKYTEMENLIQMDPIREVDESGWPKRRVFPKKAK